MKNTTRSNSGFTLVELLVVIAIIATLAGVGVPALMAKKKEGDRAEAVMNAKQIGLALFGFEQEYGSYPDDETATDISENLNETIPGGGGESNYYFRQLIVAGYIDQEKPFFAKATFTKKPDNDMQNNSMLEQGEVGFSYIMKTGNEGLSSAGNSAIPLAAAAVQGGANDDTFDTDVYNKKAVILRIDTSASIETIRPSDSKVLMGGGKTLLQTGSGSVWESGGITPAIVNPEF